ncbi:MAG: chemotaxis protein CheB [Pseudomonadota bacterium]
MDDSVTMQRWLRSVLSKDARLDVVGVAGSADEARAVIKATNPDVLTLDVEMPGMDGLQFLRHLMRLRPMPVVILSSTLRSDSANAQRAAEIGAAFCVAKPSVPTPESMKVLCDSVAEAASGQTRSPVMRPYGGRGWAKHLLLVGASTGGVAAIETFLSHVPADSPPIVIAQHMPQTFLESFMQRLGRQGPHAVAFSSHGMRLQPGEVRIAPARDQQTCVTWHSNAWHVEDVPRRYDHSFCPSVDVLFASAAPWAPWVGAVLLTGLGNDGAKGMLALRQNGGRTLGQSQDSCVVYGMPAAALAMNASEDEAPIEELPARILARMAENIQRPLR